MFKALGGFAAIVVGLIALAVVCVGVYLGYFWLYKDSGARKAGADRDIYQESPSYVQGKTQELEKMRREYLVAKDPVDKKTLKDLILHTAATVDPERLPADLKAFLTQLKATP